jgi:hypothetical protein
LQAREKRDELIRNGIGTKDNYIHLLLWFVEHNQGVLSNDNIYNEHRYSTLEKLQWSIRCSIRTTITITTTTTKTKYYGISLNKYLYCSAGTAEPSVHIIVAINLYVYSSLCTLLIN